MTNVIRKHRLLLTIFGILLFLDSCFLQHSFCVSIASGYCYVRNVWEVPVSHAKIVCVVCQCEGQQHVYSMALNCVAMVPVLDYICTNYIGVFWCQCAVEEKMGVLSNHTL